MSLMLFSNASPSSFIIFTVEVVFNYLMVQLILRSNPEKARLIAGFTIIVDVAILAYFKYLTFFVEKVLGLFLHIGTNWQTTSPLPIFHTIPPGLSFYTFEMVAFIVDTLKAKKKKPVSFLDYLNFMAFFPKIVAGPIERRSNLLPQLQSFKFKFSLENWEQGLRWLSLGVFMKFVLADNITPYINLQQTGNAYIIWLYALLFTWRIYFDFAGYSFIAIALGYFLGVKLSINFLAPYTSPNINEFWQRWHITLSNWFRDYVFIPLMGVRKEWAPFYLWLTFTLSGFWHGAAWNFIIWGAYHGTLLLLLRYLGRPFYRFLGKYMAQPQIVSWFLTFSAVTFGCLFFMENNLHRLGTKLHNLITPNAYAWHNLQEIFTQYSLNEGVTLIIVVTLAIGVLYLEHLAVWQEKFEYEFLLSRKLSPILLGLTILLAANTPSKFIYFDF